MIPPEGLDVHLALISRRGRGHVPKFEFAQFYEVMCFHLSICLQPFIETRLG